MERPELDKLLEKLSEDDTLIVTKLDRIVRSMTQSSELVTELIKRGIHVHILMLV